MNRKLVLKITAFILLIEAVALLLPSAVALYAKEWLCLKSFGITIAALLFTAMLFFGFNLKKMKNFVFPKDRLSERKKRRENFHMTEGFAVTAISWILISLFGGLPFLLSGNITDPVDCFFETVSGFTTTGATILTDVTKVSMSMNLWRCFTHWLGGMGVLVFLMAILPMGGGYMLNMMKAESPGPEVDKFTSKARDSARILYLIYIGLTVTMMILLLCGGMPFYDTLCTAFGTAGTGGFGIKADGMAGYSTYHQVVVTVFMILFGVNFNLYYLIFLGHIKDALKDEELHTYLGIMFSAIAVITAAIFLSPNLDYDNFGIALRDAAFQTSSVMSSTGYSTADFDKWPVIARGILCVLMVIGASAGSTGGGTKVSRLLITVKSVKREIQHACHPNEVKVIKLNGRKVDDKTVNSVNLFMRTYAIIIIVSFLILCIDRKDILSTFTGVLTCINNIGPGLGICGPTGNFSSFSHLSKIVLSFDMLCGRLDIFPLLVVFLPSSWSRGRRVMQRK